MGRLAPRVRRNGCPESPGKELVLAPRGERSWRNQDGNPH
jgi:hypothetical protein